jgi:MFS family permease
MARTSTMAKARRTWFSALAVVFGLVFGVVLFGWIGLVAGWFDNDADGIHRVHNVAGTGVTVGLFMAVPMLLLAFRRDDIALLQEVAVAAFAFVVAALLATDWVALAFVPIIVVPIVVQLALGGAWRHFTQPGRRLGMFALAVTIVAAPFWIAYAVTTARLQRTGLPNDPHVQMHHWTSMGGMALAIVFLGLLVAARTDGGRTVAWTVGLGATVYGLASIVFSDFLGTGAPYPGSEGVGWGLAAIGMGTTFVAAAEWEARRVRGGGPG